jgi:MFS family permease
MLYLGYGVLGGIGLGLGYVSPVSTLIRWFPDRRGMATGLAIMGFGGGAMIGAPLSVALMNHFKSATSAGVAQTFLVMGVVYFISMSIGALAIRIPAPGWAPPGFVPTAKASKMVTHANVHIDQALKTPQFYLLWLILFLNITAGIGVLGQAAVMIQETFKGSITAAAAAGFVGLLSIGNMTGRFLWSSASDYFGRKATYAIFFAFGAALYLTVPAVGASGNVALFVVCYFLILTMYGGGFSTIPAYLADMFGTAYVGGIHGRLLTAWAAAGIAGPVLVNYIREHKLAMGVPRSEVYVDTLHIMAGLLVAGFVCNLLIRPVHARHHLREAASAA